MIHAQINDETQYVVRRQIRMLRPTRVTEAQLFSLPLLEGRKKERDAKY